MAPGAISRSWRLRSLMFGMVLPWMIWACVLAIMPPKVVDDSISLGGWFDLMVYLQCGIVACATLCLGWWIGFGARSAEGAELLAIALTGAGLYAASWTLFGIVTLCGRIGAGRFGEDRSYDVLLFCGVPVATMCTWIYFRNAWLAKR